VRRDFEVLVQEALKDRYRVEREIGRGGGARVFLARDAAGRAVALKVLHPELLTDLAADRFLREMQVVAQLHHPNIAPLVDSGARGWLVFYAMRYIEGPSLRRRLDAGGPLGVEETRRLAADLLAALDHAHARGIVHRDVKPENIVLAAAGAVLLDFGIARAIAASAGDRVTRTGTAVGTSTYMSPEQIRGVRELDPRSDLYSVGCVLFECLAGEPPFVHANELVVLRRHLTEAAPPLRARRSDAPPDLASAVDRALAKEPSDRWPSAAEMARALGISLAAGTP